jgi:RIO-like serine/threonine protein kinase
MDVLKLKHHHDVAATIEKLHIEVEFVAFDKLDAISRANEVDLKLFLKRLHDGRS